MAALWLRGVATAVGVCNDKLNASLRRDMGDCDAIVAHAWYNKQLKPAHVDTDACPLNQEEGRSRELPGKGGVKHVTELLVAGDGRTCSMS